MNKKTWAGLTAAVAFTSAFGFALASPASASRPAGAHVTGDCSAGSTFFLRSGRNQGGHGHTLAVRFKLSSDGADQAWDWQVTDNGTAAASGESSTDSDGSLDLRVKIPNQKGADTVQLDAVNTVTGETCSGSVVVKGQD